ncbi:hypothetical protein PENSPDRAFT_757800 [Peniophora sp. CONT]|nr:hypothetical protein PENSPDRAFT_757800 [Peniophora sp. CONT]
MSLVCSSPGESSLLETLHSVLDDVQDIFDYTTLYAPETRARELFRSLGLRFLNMPVRRPLDKCHARPPPGCVRLRLFSAERRRAGFALDQADFRLERNGDLDVDAVRAYWGIQRLRPCSSGTGMVFAPAREDRWSALALHNLTDGKQPLLNVIYLPAPEDAARIQFPPNKLARVARHAATNPALYVHGALALYALPYLWAALLSLLALMRWAGISYMYSGWDPSLHGESSSSTSQSRPKRRRIDTIPPPPPSSSQAPETIESSSHLGQSGYARYDVPPEIPASSEVQPPSHHNVPQTYARFQHPGHPSAVLASPFEFQPSHGSLAQSSAMPFSSQPSGYHGYIPGSARPGLNEYSHYPQTPPEIGYQQPFQPPFQPGFSTPQTRPTSSLSDYRLPAAPSSGDSTHIWHSWRQWPGISLHKVPVDVRLNPAARVWYTICPCCLTHIRTSIHASQTPQSIPALLHALDKHVTTGESCSGMFASMRARFEASGQPLLAGRSPHVDSCCGVEVDTNAAGLAARFPWPDTMSPLPFRLTLPVDPNGKPIAFANECHTYWLDGLSPCPSCYGLRGRISDTVARSLDATHTRMQLSSMGVQHLRHSVEDSRVHSEEQRRLIEKLKARAEAAEHLNAQHERLLDTIIEVNPHRSATILTTNLRHTKNLDYVIQKLRDHEQGKYTPYSYTTAEFDLGLICANQGASYALKRGAGLPALSTIRNRFRSRQLLPNHGHIDLNVLRENIENCFFAHMREIYGGVWPDKPILMHVTTDEISTERQPTFDAQRDMVANFCWEHTPPEVLMLTDQKHVEALRDGLDGDVYHLGVEMSTMAMKVHGRDGVIPFFTASTCKKHDSNAMAALFGQVFEILVNHPDFAGHFVLGATATDGDAARRNYFHRLCCTIPMDTSNTLYAVLSQLRGFNLCIGPYNMTVDFDWKHGGLKRPAGGVRGPTGFSVNDGTVIHGQIVYIVISKAEKFAHRAYKLTHPDDPQDVPAALELLQVLCELPNAVHDQKFLAEHAREMDAITFLAEILSGIIDVYTNVENSLSRQATLLSKVAHLLFASYRAHGSSAFNVELYHDLIQMIRNFYISLLKQQMADPKAIFFFGDLGTDDLEKLFGLTREESGHRGTFNGTEFLVFLSHALQKQEAFARQPHLKRVPKRLELFTSQDHDHIERRHMTGDLIAGNCDLPHCWSAGADLAQEVLDKSQMPSAARNLAVMLSQPDIDIVCPLGKDLVPGYNSGQEAKSTESIDKDAEIMNGERALEPTPVTGDRDLPDGADEQALGLVTGLPFALEQDESPFDGEDIDDPEDSLASSSAEIPEIPTLPEGRGIIAAHYMLYNGRYVHKSTICKLAITPESRLNAGDRLDRVRFHSSYNVRSAINQLIDGDTSNGEWLTVGELVIALARHQAPKSEASMSLAVLRVKSLLKGGSPINSVSIEALANPSNKLQLIGQVMSARRVSGQGVPISSSSPSLEAAQSYERLTSNMSEGDEVFNFSILIPGSYLRTPTRKAKLGAPDKICEVTVPSTTVRKVPYRMVWSTGRATQKDIDNHVINSKGWLPEYTERELQAAGSEMYEALKSLPSFNLGMLASLDSLSTGFPYASGETKDEYPLLCKAGTKDLEAYGKGRDEPRGQCRIASCGQLISGTEDAPRAHLGWHYAHKKFDTGLHQPTSNDKFQFPSESPCCCFCGSPSCRTYLSLRGGAEKTVYHSSDCPHKPTKGVTYGKEGFVGTKKRPSTNAPIVCHHCPDLGHRLHLAVASYDLEEHYNRTHSEYATPHKLSGQMLPHTVLLEMCIPLKEQVALGIPTDCLRDPKFLIERYYTHFGVPVPT